MRRWAQVGTCKHRAVVSSCHWPPAVERPVHFTVTYVFYLLASYRNNLLKEGVCPIIDTTFTKDGCGPGKSGNNELCLVSASRLALRT